MNVNEAIEFITDPIRFEIPENAAIIAPHEGWQEKSNLIRIYKEEDLREFVEGNKPEPMTRIPFSAKDIVKANDIVLLIATAASEQISNGQEVDLALSEDLANYLDNLSPDQVKRGKILLESFKKQAEIGKECELEIHTAADKVEKVQIPAAMVTHLLSEIGIEKEQSLDRSHSEAILESMQVAHREFEQHAKDFEDQLRGNKKERQEAVGHNEEFLKKFEANRKRVAFIYDAQLKSASENVQLMALGLKMLLNNEIKRLEKSHPAKGSVAQKQLSTLKVALAQLDQHKEFIKSHNQKNIDNIFKRTENLKHIVEGLEKRLNTVGYPGRLERACMACRNALVCLLSLFSNKYKPEIYMRAKRVDSMKQLTSHYHSQLMKVKGLVGHERPEYGKNRRLKH